MSGADRYPGGKAKTALPPGMRGGAAFAGPGDRYRLELWREWGDPGAPYALFVGMNPSTADAEFNDPTVAREIGFTRAVGLTRYVKCNVSAYRATYPAELALPGVQLDTPENRFTIMRRAKTAAVVVLAFGALRGTMRDLARVIVQDLRAHDVAMHCLGITKDGSPRRPLYLPASAQLQIWRGWE